MFLKEALQFSISALRANPIRSLLTTLAMAIGTASVILVVTISLIGRDYILEEVEGIGSNLIFAYYTGATSSSPTSDADSIKLADLEAIRQELSGDILAATGVMSDVDRIRIHNREQDVNFMRNMGSSVGTSLVTTLIARRSQFHQARLVQDVRVDSPNFVNSANGLAQHLANSGVGKHEAHIVAYARIYQSLQAQAASLAYIDTFMVLAVGAAIMFCLAFVLKKNDPGGGGPSVVE